MPLTPSQLEAINKQVQDIRAKTQAIGLQVTPVKPPIAAGGTNIPPLASTTLTAQPGVSGAVPAAVAGASLLNPQMDLPMAAVAGASLLTPAFGEKPSTVLPETKTGIYTTDLPRQQDLAKKVAAQNAEVEKQQNQQQQIVSLTNEQIIKQKKAEMGLEPPPVAYDSKATRSVLRGEYGLAGMETAMQGVNKLLLDAQASLTAGIDAESRSGLPMELVTGRVDELRRQGNEKIQLLQNTKALLQDEYNTKVGIIGQIMQDQQQDFANANTTYQNKFTQAVQLQDIIAGERKEEQTQENIAQDNARANLSVLIDLAKGSDMTNMSPDTKAQINKLSLQAGMPSEVVNYALSKSAGGAVTPHFNSYQDASGEYVQQIIYTDSQTGRFVGAENVRSGIKGEVSGTTGTGIGAADANLVAAIIKNPSLYDTITPSQRANVLVSLNAQGYDVGGIVSPTFKKASAMAQASFNTAINQLDVITEKSQRVITATNAWETLSQQMKSQPYVNRLFPDMKIYTDTVDAFTSMLARAVGEKGVLTDFDLARVKKSLPLVSDTVYTASEKLSTFKKLLTSIKDGTIDAYTAKQYGLTINESNTGTLAQPSSTLSQGVKDLSKYEQ